MPDPTTQKIPHGYVKSIKDEFDQFIQKEEDPRKKLQIACRFLKDIKQGKIYGRDGRLIPPSLSYNWTPDKDALAYVEAEIEFLEKIPETWQPEELIEGEKQALQRGRKKSTKRQDYAKSPELIRDFLHRLHKKGFVDQKTTDSWKEIHKGRFRDSKTMIDESAPRMNWIGSWVEFREMFQFVRFAGLFSGNRWGGKHPGEWMDSQWLFNGHQKTAREANSGWGNAKSIDEQRGMLLHRAISEVVQAQGGNKDALDGYYFQYRNAHHHDST